MPNTWKKKIVDQGYNYFDGPVNSMAEFLKTRSKILEKSIPPKIPSRIKKNKKVGSKKRKAVTFGDSEDED